MGEKKCSCPKQQTNIMRCPCPFSDCAYHGVCCECIAYHLPQKQLPQCIIKAMMPKQR